MRQLKQQVNPYKNKSDGGIRYFPTRLMSGFVPLVLHHKTKDTDQ